MATTTLVRLDTTATSRVPSAVTIKLVMQCLGRHDADNLVACPISGCRAAAFKYNTRRFDCRGCDASGDAIDLARRMGLGDDSESFVRALVFTGDRSPAILWRGLRLGLTRRATVRRSEDARREREEQARAIRRAYGAIDHHEMCRAA